MPEGPEVAIISKCLNSSIQGDKIVSLKIWKDSRYKEKDHPLFDPLVGKIISEISFKGKKIIFSFEDNSYAISFLGMEGKWKILYSFDPMSKHVSLIFNLKSGKILQFQDQRHFGCLNYFKDYQSLQDSLSKTVGIPWIPSSMYPEIISKEVLYTLLQNKRLHRKYIMMFLIDQKYTSGIGNYIRSDVLYLAKISPYKLVNDISRKESDKIHDSVLKVMKEAMQSGGHTIRTYFTPIGDKGGYEPYVYGRSTSKQKNEKIIKEYDSQKRSIYWVSEVQA